MDRPGASARRINGPVTGAQIAEAGGAPMDMQGMLDWAREAGGPVLRRMTFHERAKMIKALALYLGERKEELYAINPMTAPRAATGQSTSMAGSAR